MQGIYAIANTTDGKRYIGSAVNIRKRWEIHRYHLRRETHHCQHLQRAWIKYGSSVFQWVILEEVTDDDVLLVREQFWLDTTPMELRYNTSPTAGNIRGYIQPPEVRRKHAISWQDKHLTPEHAAKLIEGRKRVPQTEHARQAISMALYERIRKPETGYKIGQSKASKPCSENHRAALRAAKAGKTHSEAWFLAMANRRIPTDEHIVEMRTRYQNGQSMLSIAKQMGFPYSCVRKIVRK